MPPRKAARSRSRLGLRPEDVEVLDVPAPGPARVRFEDRVKGWVCPWGCVPLVTAEGERVPAWWCPQWREDPVWVKRTPFDVTAFEPEIARAYASEAARESTRIQD